jgi:hypothetical protein
MNRNTWRGDNAKECPDGKRNFGPAFFSSESSLNSRRTKEIEKHIQGAVPELCCAHGKHGQMPNLQEDGAIFSANAHADGAWDRQGRAKPRQNTVRRRSRRPTDERAKTRFHPQAAPEEKSPSPEKFVLTKPLLPGGCYFKFNSSWLSTRCLIMKFSGTIQLF